MPKCWAGPAMVANGIGLKLYACCRNVHRPLDAVPGLVQPHTFAPYEVEHVECEISIVHPYDKPE